MTRTPDASPSCSGSDSASPGGDLRDHVTLTQSPTTRHVLSHQGGAVEGQVLGILPPQYPEWLGSRRFCRDHGCRFPYVVGAMAGGISSVSMVLAAARAGILCYLGSGGVRLDVLRAWVDEIRSELGGSGAPWGVNLLHAPGEEGLEAATVELLLSREVRRISASAFVRPTAPLVKYACAGLKLDARGALQRRQRVCGKISRVETARMFLAPPPGELLRRLQASGELTAEEVALASRYPLADAITVEADSAGHTDRQVMGAILPTILDLRSARVAMQEPECALHIGAAGGMGTPPAVAAAFAMGADYVLTGSVNAATREAGLSTKAKEMLGAAGVADTAMAPSADMFELGAQVQVLKRQTMFAARATELRRLFDTYDGLDQIPGPKREQLENKVFRASLDAVWEETRRYWAGRKPEILEGITARQQMALVFRWYLGRSARWAIEGTPGREIDYQLWAGPALGSFNEWVRGSWLEPLENRGVVDVALNLLEGAAYHARMQALRQAGVQIPWKDTSFRPRRLLLQQSASSSAGALGTQP